MNEPAETDLVFQALASRQRRLIMDLVKQMPGCCLNDICEHFDMSRIGVMKHLQVLVDAKLILSRKQGRTRELFFNSAPIQMVYDRWTDEYSAFWATQVVDLKYKVESKKKLVKSSKPTSSVDRKTKSIATRKKPKPKTRQLK